MASPSLKRRASRDGDGGTVSGRNGSARSTTTIGAYLIERLQSLEVNHVFGIPGDYILGCTN